MSGGRYLAAGRAQEKADVLAYLARRLRNARSVVAATPPGDELHGLAADRARQLLVVIDEIAQDLHHGVAETEALLADGLAGDEFR